MARRGFGGFQHHEPFIHSAFELRHVHKGFDIIGHHAVIADVFAAVVGTVAAAGQDAAENIDDARQTLTFMRAHFLHTAQRQETVDTGSGGVHFLHNGRAIDISDPAGR